MAVIEDIFKGGVEGLLSGVKGIVNIWKTDSTVLTANDQEKARWANNIALAEVELKKLEFQAEVVLVTAQTEVNKIEAASADWFVRRARPAAMWVCVIGFAYQNVLWPFLAWFSLNYGWKEPPLLPSAALETMLFALLGVGAYRSFDKLKGTTK